VFIPAGVQKIRFLMIDDKYCQKVSRSPVSTETGDLVHASVPVN
jgi:hypothetical protein